MSKARESVAGEAAGPAALPDRPSRRLSMLLATIVVGGFLVYAVCLFKHISYPLMWADESMTAVGAQRVLQFGYPKVHDGRNVFYDLRHSNPELGIEPKTDAYIGGAGWGHYYFAAPFVVLSKLATDFYHQTAILRIPFALAGFAGLLLLLWTGIRSVPDRVSRLAVAATYVLLILPSIPLQLHLREVRYYSLQLLLTALALTVFAAYHLRGAIGFRAYLLAVASLVPLLFLTFSPAALAFCLATGLYLAGEGLSGWRKREDSGKALFQAKLRSLGPVGLGLVIVAPLAWFFRTADMSRQLAEFYGYTLATYLEHLGVLGGYFTRFDILICAMAAKLLLLALWRNNPSTSELRPTMQVSLLLTVYGIVHALVVARIPNALFTRYFITLQPLLVLTFALDLLMLARLSMGTAVRRRMAGGIVAAVLLVGALAWSYARNLPYIEGRLHEISHQYKGVLDYVIPYLRDNHADPSRLVIATNYEETSYIYYLGSRVIIGFVNPDLQRELQKGLPEQPDCIVFRRFWAGLTDPEIFQTLFGRATYVPVQFPVYDHGFNNTPDVIHWSPNGGWLPGWHYFRTAHTEDPQRMATLFLRASTQGQTSGAGVGR